MANLLSTIVTGGSGTTPTLSLDRNIATPSNYYNGVQLEIKATSGTAGIGLHRNGFSHVGIYHNAVNELRFDMNSGTVILNHNTGTIWGSGNLTNLDQLTNGPGYITSVGNITRLWAESHPTDYYIRANWTGSYWQLTSNHPSPVQVGYADNSGALSGLGVGSFLRDDGWNTSPGQDANTQEQMRVDFTYSNNAPYTGELIRFGSSGYSTQFNTSYGDSDNFAFRTRNGDNGTWNPWRAVIHSGNIGSQSVNYATSAGTLTNNATISGLNFGGVLALTGSGASTGNSTGARLTESYGPQWNLGNGSTWHYQILNGSLLVGISAAGVNYGSGNIRASGDIFSQTNNAVIHAGNIASQTVASAGNVQGFSALALIEESIGVHSGSDFVNGTLVVTDIDANGWAGNSFVMEVSGKSYDSGNSPFKLVMQGYLYADTIINVSAMSYGSYFPAPVIAMRYNGKLSFWWPRASYWNSFLVHVRNADGESYNRVTSISNSVNPDEGDKKVSCTPIQVIHTNNIGSQSVSYATNAGDASTLGGFGRGNTTNKIAYFDGDRNLYVNNPETYTGEVRLGAAWGRGGVYASNTLSLSTSGTQTHFVFNNSVPIIAYSTGQIDLGGSSNYPIDISGAAHKYLQINPGNGYEAMVRYIGGSGSSWYVGKRTANQLVGTESFHFYSEAAAQTVGGIDTSGNMIVTGSMRAPIFYDSQDTGYYVDPNDISQLHISRTALRAHRSMSGYGAGNWISDFGQTPISSMTFGQDKYDGGPSGTWWFQVNMRHNNGNNVWGTQLAYGWEDNANRILQRNVTGGNWSGWVEYLNSGNFTSWAQEKENQRLSTSSSVTFTNIYNNAWFRNNNVNEGVYNQATGTHLYSHSAQGWVVTGSGGTIELQFRSNHQSTLRGYVYADTNNNIGFLTNGGGWSLRTNSSANVFVHGPELTINADNASYSNINMNDGDEGQRVIHCNSNRIGFLTQAGAWGSYCSDDGSWTSVGDITAFSDERLKTNIKTIENALKKTLKMRGVSYNRTDSDDRSDKVGVIAQEVFDVLPEVVKEGADGMLSVSYGNIVGVLIEAIKEQQAQIDELKAKLDGLTK